MKLNQKNLKQLKNVLEQKANDFEENKEVLNNLEKELQYNLTDEEIKLFNQEKYFDIIPILYMFEFLDQTGMIEIASTYEHKCVLIQDCGCSEEDIDAEVRRLKRVWSCLIEF